MNKPEYLDQALNHEILNLKQEQELKNKLPDDEYRKQLVLNNLRFAFVTAKKYEFKFKNSNSRISGDDLFSVCCEGLINAARGFDVNRGVKFFSYATRAMIHACQRFISSNKNQFHMSSYTSATFEKISQYEQKFENKFGRRPKEETVKKAVGVTSEMCFAYKTRLSIEDRLNEELPSKDSAGASKIDILSVRDQEDTFEKADIKDRLELIVKSLEALTKKEKQIIIKYYGLYNKDSVNFSEIGRELKLSRERIRQVHNIAIAKIQRSFKRNQIKDIL